MNEKIVDVIKSYNEYSYDEILDCYSNWHTTDLLYYMKVKQNHYEIPQIMRDIKQDYNNTFLFVFNIQRKLDNKQPVLDIDEMYDTISNLLRVDTDVDNEDEFDF